MLEDLHIKYRPKSLDKVIGQESTVKSLKNLLKKEKPPHAFLLTGPSGCGKTTIARILADSLNCSHKIEVDAATNTGVDDARKLTEGLRYKTIGENSNKFILIDECFAKGTLISTPDGDIPIQKINKDTYIFNIEGVSKVTNVFKNKVYLNRVLKVQLSNKEVIFCSEDHEFLLEQGWVKAKNLVNKDLLLQNFHGKVMCDITLLSTHKQGTENFDKIKNKEITFSVSKNMQGVFKSFFCKILECYSLRYLQGFNKDMPCMRERVHNRKENKTLLFKSLWEYFGRDKKAGGKTRVLERGYIKRLSEIKKGKSQKLGKKINEIFKKNVTKESYVRSEEHKKNDGHKKDKWNIKYWFWRQQGREWEIKYSTNDIVFCSGLAYRGGYCYRKQAEGWKWLPNMLQGRHREQRIKVSNRGRWDWTQIEKFYIKRQEENRKIKQIRVVSIESYERGSNEESFSGIIGHKEKDQDFVEFYDLEVEGHPSYFANKVAVHNCHMLSKSAWNSLLKVIEEPPEHVYWAFCTTEPGKVPKTVKTRTHAYDLGSVKTDDLFDLLDFVRSEEDMSLNDECLDVIAKESNGSPRQALVYLSMADNCKNKQEVLQLLKSADESAEIIDLCRLLVGGNVTWKKAIKILNKLKENEVNPESIRIVVVNYVNSVLLKTKDENKAIYLLSVLDAFSSVCNPSEKMAPILLALGDCVFTD